MHEIRGSFRHEGASIVVVFGVPKADPLVAIVVLESCPLWDLQSDKQRSRTMRRARNAFLDGLRISGTLTDEQLSRLGRC